jgi:Lhr-like helicase
MEINLTQDDVPEYSNISIEAVQKMVEWDRKYRKLKDHHFKYMVDLIDGKMQMTEQAKRYVKLNLQVLNKFGFKL